jgi:hypothetical protein
MVGPSRKDMEIISLLNPLELIYRAGLFAFNTGRATRRTLSNIELKVSVFAQRASQTQFRHRTRVHIVFVHYGKDVCFIFCAFDAGAKRPSR